MPMVHSLCLYNCSTESAAPVNFCNPLLQCWSVLLPRVFIATAMEQRKGGDDSVTERKNLNIKLDLVQLAYTKCELLVCVLFCKAWEWLGIFSQNTHELV